jgi:hypothetical protein
MIYYVDGATGSDSQDEGYSWAHPFDTIAYAISQLPCLKQYTATIYVKAGTYTENISIYGNALGSRITIIGVYASGTALTSSAPVETHKVKQTVTVTDSITLNQYQNKMMAFNDSDDPTSMRIIDSNTATADGSATITLCGGLVSSFTTSAVYDFPVQINGFINIADQQPEIVLSGIYINCTSAYHALDIGYGTRLRIYASKFQSSEKSAIYVDGGSGVDIYNSLLAGSNSGYPVLDIQDNSNCRLYGCKFTGTLDKDWLARASNNSLVDFREGCILNGGMYGAIALGSSKINLYTDTSNIFFENISKNRGVYVVQNSSALDVVYATFTSCGTPGYYAHAGSFSWIGNESMFDDAGNNLGAGIN